MKYLLEILRFNEALNQYINTENMSKNSSDV